MKWEGARFAASMISCIWDNSTDLGKKALFVVFLLKIASFSSMVPSFGFYVSKFRDHSDNSKSRIPDVSFESYE